mgnify:CR=1 FL=1
MLKFIVTIFTVLFFSSIYSEAKELEPCTWDNRDSVPCVSVAKPIPNTSEFSKIGVKSYTITSREIREHGANDINDVLEMIPGLNITQSGPTGQQTSLFTRGTNSNHTLVLLNGIPINDQSTTQGLHDFGVDFIQTIHQVEVYLGPNGAHFGPNAIGGAVNFITTGDFSNSLEVSGIEGSNKRISLNYTKVTDNDWMLNAKGGLVNGKTDSAIYGGSEKDKVKNLSTNLNAEKWLNDNIKFRSTVYARETIAEYDGSVSAEDNYKGDNLMYAAQLGFDHQKENLKDYITFHFHTYDREYNEEGTIDEYLSKSFMTRSERQIQLNEKISLGFGGEYKYDWGEFENRGSSYSASTKGNVDNKSLFSNLGFKIHDNTRISLYGRSDKHKTTGVNNTQKINITQFIDKFKFGLTHSTGLRNPSLYELYGTDSSGYSGNLNLNPEKTKSNEISAEYSFSDNLLFSVTGFKSNIFDHVEYKNKKYVNDVTKTDLNQSGVETQMNWKGKDQNLSVFVSSLSSKKTNGIDQLRRPEKIYGAKYQKNLNTDYFGTVKLRLKYQHYGKHWDTHSSNWSTILMDSSDIADISLLKSYQGYDWSFNITNLFDESYQRPHGYTQEGRQIRFGIKKKY